MTDPRQLAASRRWKERNAEHVRAYRKRYYERNRQRERAQSRVYKDEHREEIRAYQKAYTAEYYARRHIPEHNREWRQLRAEIEALAKQRQVYGVRARGIRRESMQHEYSEALAIERVNCLARAREIEAQLAPMYERLKELTVRIRGQG